MFTDSEDIRWHVSRHTTYTAWNFMMTTRAVQDVEMGSFPGGTDRKLTSQDTCSEIRYSE
jgi:hypothetical protein